MLKKWLIVIAILVVVFGGIFGSKAYTQHRAAVAAAHRHFPPVTISTAVARAQTWGPRVRAVATVAAVSGTQITAQIAGDVTKVAFQSGTAVAKGDLLVQLDDSTQLARLHADQARLRLAKTKVARARKLFAAHATSQAQLQNAQAAIATAQAAIEGDRAVLRKLHITAPFAGRVGIREVSLGQYVSPGTPIVDLQSYQPIHVNFSLPQSDLRNLQTGEDLRFVTDAYPDHTFIGTITSIDSRIDPHTRNVGVQATFANAHKRLRPGMFGTAIAHVGTPVEGVVVPGTAIAYSSFGDTVYLVRDPPDEKETVHAVIVKVGQQRGAMIMIRSGVKPGDVVVTAGQNKLHDGAAVTVNNVIKP